MDIPCSRSASPVRSFPKSLAASPLSSVSHGSFFHSSLDFTFNYQVEFLSHVHLRDSSQLEGLFLEQESTLVILGNMVHGDNRGLLYELIFRACCRYERVYYVLGEFEMTSSEYTIHDILYYIRSLTALYDGKFTVLHNTIIVDDENKLIVFGSPFWNHIESPYTSTYFPMIRLGHQIPMDAIRHNILHYQAVQQLHKAMVMAHHRHYDLLVFTSYAPEKITHDGHNYTSSDWDIFVHVPCIVIWAMGHSPMIYYSRS